MAPTVWEKMAGYFPLMNKKDAFAEFHFAEIWMFYGCAVNGWKMEIGDEKAAKFWKLHDCLYQEGGFDEYDQACWEQYVFSELKDMTISEITREGYDCLVPDQMIDYGTLIKYAFG